MNTVAAIALAAGSSCAVLEVVLPNPLLKKSRNTAHNRNFLIKLDEALLAAVGFPTAHTRGKGNESTNSSIM